MDLKFSDEQQLFGAELNRFVDDRCGFEARRCLVASDSWGDEAVWSGLAELGCLGVTVPASAGGFTSGTIEAGLVARAVGRGLLVEPVLPALAAGILLAGVDSPDETVAALISGERRFAILDGNEMRSVVGGMAATDFLWPHDGGLSIYPESAVQRRPVRLLDDSLGADVRVTEKGEHLVATPDWDTVMERARAVTRIALVWQALGSMEQALVATSAHLRERRQFGKPLSAFQVVQHRIGEMAVAVQEAEVAALLAALTLDAAGPGIRTDRAVAVAANCIVGGADLVARGAVQMHGGMGVSDELDISARFRQLQAIRTMLRDDDHYADNIVAAGLHRDSIVMEAA